METEVGGGPEQFEVSRNEVLEDAVEAWAEVLNLQQRRDLEGRILGAVREALTERIRRELSRFIGPFVPSVEDAVHQTIVELPAILASYIESARADRAGARRVGGFQSYLMNAARNVACDLAKAALREHEHLGRMLGSHPSRLGRLPTTPSQSGMRAEIRDLLAVELTRFQDMDQRILRRRAEQVDFAEIGRELGMPRETVRDRYHLCASRLRRVIERALGGDPFVSS